MVSDSDLVSWLRDILRSSDLDTATAGSVRRQLEEDFGLDLSDRKAFIREQIDVFVQTLNGNQEEGEDANVVVKEEESQVENDGDKEELEEEVESKGKGNKRGRSKGAEKEVKKGGGGFAKLCSLSPQLQEVVGVPELARTEVVKRLWAYIRGKDLQDPKNKRNIRCDDTLHALFHVNSINMFQMNKALSKHIWPLASEDAKKKPMVEGDDVGTSTSEEENTGKEVGEDGEEDDVEKKSNQQSEKGRYTKGYKDVKKRGGGFTKLCSLSPQLQEFIGEPKLARTEVVKKLWAYIREKNLQDRNNRRNIICDKSLCALFNVDSIDMFQMNKALSKHIFPLNEENDKSNVKERRKEQGIEEGSIG